MLRTVIGVLIVMVLNVGMNKLVVNPGFQQVIFGGIIILAVALTIAFQDHDYQVDHLQMRNTNTALRSLFVRITCLISTSDHLNILPQDITISTE